MSAGSTFFVRPVLKREFLRVALEAGQRALAFAAALPAAPVLLASAALVRALSHRSPFVAHRRVGQYNRPFWVLKLRTMWDNAPVNGSRCGWVEFLRDETGPRFKSSADPRVTSRFARLCRRFSLDELPQLLQVAAGQMALVGPRPLTQSELRLHYRDSAPEVLEVKPGLTGLWQVMGRNRLTYPQRRRLDLFYVRRRCLRLHLWILARTVACVLTGKNSW